MKRKVVLLLILSIIFIPGQVKADTEKKLVEENGEYYCYINGKKQSGFQTIDGKTYFFSRIGDNAMRTGTFAVDGPYYHFDENGVMKTGIVEENGNKYYFDETGKRVGGFQTVDGKTYFFSRVGDNAMRTGTFAIDGPYYHFDENGVMKTGIVEENGNKYYFDNSGKRVGGFQTVDGKTYFFSRVGDNAMRTGAFQIDGVNYRFNNDGTAYVGIYEENNQTYYYDNNGRVTTGIVTIDGKRYFFNSEGVKSWGFQKYNNHTYFFSRINDHAIRTGFFQIDDYYYLFLETGEMVTGFSNKQDGIMRFFSRVDGHMRTGWVNIDGVMYYFDPSNGAMTTGEKTIDDVNYVFQSDGKLKDGFVTDTSGNVRYYFTDGSYANDWVTIAGTKYFFNGLGVMIAKDAKKVIDVSYHNKDIDWWTAKNYGGVDAAIIRLAYRGYGTGSLVTDTKFLDNINGAASQNLPIGVYVYSQAINKQEAIEEAERAINLVNENGGKSKFSMPIVIDTEYTDAWYNGKRAGRADYLSKEERTDVVIAFIERVRQAGYEPMIYASKSFLNDNLNMNRIGNVKLWVAQYYHYCTYNGIGEKVMWQYSSTEQIPGISTNTDVSVMF